VSNTKPDTLHLFEMHERFGALSRVSYCLHRPGYPIPYVKLGATLEEVAAYLRQSGQEVLPLPLEEGWPDECQDLTDEAWATIRNLMAK
jgi:hypothetical protein